MVASAPVDVGARQEERELVAADAIARIGLPNGGPDEAADLGQQLVPGGVAPGVVDPLELVDVEEHERERRPVAARLVDHPGDGLLERAMVAEAGEAVTERGVPRRLVQVVEARALGLELGSRVHDLAGHPPDEADEEGEEADERGHGREGDRGHGKRRGRDDAATRRAGAGRSRPRPATSPSRWPPCR